MRELRVFGDKVQFIINQRLLVMHIGVSYQLQYTGSLCIILKSHLKFFIDIAESLDPGILSRGNLPACFNNLRHSTRFS